MQNTNHNFSEYHAAVYVRLSKEDNNLSYGRKTESNSISNQKQLIFDFLKSKSDIKIDSIRVDDGYTGTNYDRPAFQLMLDDIKAGLINCVVVKDLSRFGREYIDAGKYIDRLFPFYGVRLIAVNDGIDTITRNTADEFGITVRNLFNDNYCRDISVKTRSSLRVKRKNGEYTGAFAPYGYKRSETDHNRLVIDEYPAAVVQDIFRWKLEGMSQNGIANRLNELGVLSPTEYKRSLGLRYQSGFKMKENSSWTAVTVRRILTNDLYLGRLIQGVRTTPNYKLKTTKINAIEDCCVVEESHEAIITQKQFDLVSKLLLLDTRTSPNEDRVFPLAGMVECGDCKSPMVKKASAYKDKKYYYYVCKKNKEQHTCSGHRISTEDLESAVLSILRQHIQTIVSMNAVLNSVGKMPFRQIHLKKAEERIACADKEISRYRSLKISLYEDMKEGIVSIEDYRDIKQQYEERITVAEKGKNQAKKELEKLLNNTTDHQIWMQNFIQYQNLTRLTRTVAVELIEKVVIYEEKKISVEFRHTQDYQLLVENLNELSNSHGMKKEVV
ncbi:MAG: recombinase family protein [Monoglobales bacterium]